MGRRREVVASCGGIRLRLGLVVLALDNKRVRELMPAYGV